MNTEQTSKNIFMSILNIHNHLGIKLLTRLRPGLSHLREHNFRLL